MRIHSNSLYLTDNGCALCGDHLGATARATGHDISGQRIARVTHAMAQTAQAEGWQIACEACGKTASTLVVV
jgi:hypothetical protein